MPRLGDFAFWGSCMLVLVIGFVWGLMEVTTPTQFQLGDPLTLTETRSG